MATEITCIVADSEERGERVEGVGGPGWTKDTDTVIGEIEEGRAARRSDPSEISSGSQREGSEAAAFMYFVEVGAARVTVLIAVRESRTYLRTDPDESAENNLLTLPICP